jgi:hypothetical protein
MAKVGAIMNHRIIFILETLKQIEDAVVDKFPDGGGSNGVRIAWAVQMWCSMSQTADLEAIEKAIYEGNPR